MKTRTLVAAVAAIAVIGTCVGIAAAQHSHSFHPSLVARGAVSPGAATSPRKPIMRTYAVGHGNNVYAYTHTNEHDVAWVIKVHGGYWETGSGHRSDMVRWALHEQARGYAAFTVDYRLIPGVHWPTPLDDVEHAITWIRAHAKTWGLDLHSGFIIGSSAGGLLACAAALRLGGFLGVITLAGAVDPYDEYLHDPNPLLRKAAFELNDSKTPQQDPSLWQDSRAVHYLGKDKMRFLLIHSLHDATVSVATSRKFYGELKAAGYSATLDVVSGASHPPTGTIVLDTQDDWMAALVHASRAKKVLANK